MIESFDGEIRKALRKDPGRSGKQIYSFLQELGYGGGKTEVTYRVHQIKAELYLGKEKSQD